MTFNDSSSDFNSHSPIVIYFNYVSLISLAKLLVDKDQRQTKGLVCMKSDFSLYCILQVSKLIILVNLYKTTQKKLECQRFK